MRLRLAILLIIVELVGVQIQAVPPVSRVLHLAVGAVMLHHLLLILLLELAALAEAEEARLPQTSATLQHPALAVVVLF
jgi:hypothetical protein